MTDETRSIIFGLACPALITGALLVPGWLRKPADAGTREPWPWRIPLAVGLPVCLAFVALYGFPGKQETWRTAAFAPMLGLAASLVLLFRRSWLRAVLTVALAVGLAVLVLPYTRTEHWSIKAIPAALVLTLVGSLEPLAARTKGPSIAIPLAVSTAVGAALVLVSGSIKLTVPLGALTISVVLLAVYSLWRRHLSLTRGPLFIVLPTTSTAIFFQWLYERYAEGPIPPAAFGLVALAPMYLWIGEIPWIRSRREWFAVVLRTFFVAAPCAAGLYLAATATKAGPSDSSGDMYREMMGK